MSTEPVGDESVRTGSFRTVKASNPIKMFHFLAGNGRPLSFVWKRFTASRARGALDAVRVPHRSGIQWKLGSFEWLFFNRKLFGRLAIASPFARTLATVCQTLQRKVAYWARFRRPVEQPKSIGEQAISSRTTITKCDRAVRQKKKLK